MTIGHAVRGGFTDKHHPAGSLRGLHLSMRACGVRRIGSRHAKGESRMQHQAYKYELTSGARDQQPIPTANVEGPSFLPDVWEAGRQPRGARKSLLLFLCCESANRTGGCKQEKGRGGRCTGSRARLVQLPFRLITPRNGSTFGSPDPRWGHENTRRAPGGA